MESVSLVPELMVTSLNESLSFYINLLGFEIKYQREEENFAYIKKGNVEIMLEQITTNSRLTSKMPEYPFGQGVNFQIEVEDIDTMARLLESNNVKLFLPIEDKWYRKGHAQVGNRQFCVLDPDGYLLRFYKDLGLRNIKS